MLELLHNPTFVVFAFVGLATIVPVIAHYLHKAYRDSLEAKLKQEMVRQGMSAEEIVLVLKASKSQPDEMVEES
ncbi:MAG TPA: hypothetical protein VGX76_21595 [Pirellulales bacterium]|nr:hypothetical protein [Pirellulales bacterium]